MGMRTVQLCNIKLPRINQKPMDSRTIINLLSSAMCETKRTHTHTHVRARVKRKRSEQLHFCACVCSHIYTKTFHIGTERIQQEI